MTIPAPASRPASRRLLMLSSILLLCACGQTGALYLPEETPEGMPEEAREQEPKRQVGDNH